MKKVTRWNLAMVATVVLSSFTIAAKPLPPEPLNCFQEACRDDCTYTCDEAPCTKNCKREACWDNFLVLHEYNGQCSLPE